jgi:hypothetical protein
LGTSGGRELVVAVVVLGPALTVPAVVVAGDDADAVEVALVVVLAELLEWLEPPQAGTNSVISTTVQRVRRRIGAL